MGRTPHFTHFHGLVRGEALSFVGDDNHFEVYVPIWRLTSQCEPQLNSQKVIAR